MDFRYLESLAGTTKPDEPPPVCLTCGYDLRGSTSGRCPECGQSFTSTQWKRESSEIKTKTADVDEALKWVALAWKVVAAGAALEVLGFIVMAGSCGSWLLRIAGAFCGLAAFFLGVNIFRTRQLPEWARERLSTKPDYVSAYVGIFGGLLLVATTILAL